MDVITSYLDTLFAPHPATTRMREARTQLQALMETASADARASGLSEHEAVARAIAEYGDLDEMAPRLGIAEELARASEHTTAPAATHPAGDGPRAAIDTSADTQPIDTDSLDIPPPSAVPTAPGPQPAPAAIQHPGPSFQPPPASGLAPVTLDEARAFAEDARRAQRLLTVAVILFVLSPTALIALPVLSALPVFALTDAVSSLIGLFLLAVLVFLGVTVVLRRSRVLRPHRRLIEGRFEEDPAVTAWAQEVRESAEGKRARALVIAVGCWILSPIPTIASGVLADSDAPWPRELAGIGVPGTLLLVALGLAIFLPTAWAAGVAETLEDDHDPHAVDDDTPDPPAIRILKAVLWPLTLATYLAWSFLGNSWGASWLVWPLAGIVYWALSSVADAWKGRSPA